MLSVLFSQKMDVEALTVINQQKERLLLRQVCLSLQTALGLHGGSQMYLCNDNSKMCNIHFAKDKQRALVSHKKNMWLRIIPCVVICESLWIQLRQHATAQCVVQFCESTYGNFQRKHDLHSNQYNSKEQYKDYFFKSTHQLRQTYYNQVNQQQNSAVQYSMTMMDDEFDKV